MNKGFTHILLLMVVLIVLAGAGVYFLSNKKAPVTEVNTQESNPGEVTTTSDIFPTQASIPTSDDLVSFELEGEMFSISRKKFPSPYKGSSGIYSVIQAFYSPQKNYITILADSGLTPMALYYMGTDTKNIVLVDLVEEAIWSPNESHIAFTSRPADAGPTQILKVYEIASKKTSGQYVNNDNLYCYAGYSDINWIDNSSFSVKYTGFDCPFNSAAKPTSEGFLTISASELLAQ